MDEFPTLLVTHISVQKYYKLNGFMLRKLADEQLFDDLKSLHSLYEKVTDLISDFSFVVQELNLDLYPVYTQQLVILMLQQI